MNSTPNNLKPHRTPPALDPALAGQAPTTQFPPQAEPSIPQMAAAETDLPPPEPVIDEGPSPDQLAAIAARRRGMPKAGDLQMAVPQRVGWARRWVNDTPGRLQKFLKKGWDFVKSPETGENWLLVVNKNISSAGGLRGYVMEIPLQFYAEDQEAKQESLDALDAAIYGGTHNEEPDDKRYVPRSTPIKVETRIGSGRG
jgi:hypothetical protein